MRRFLFILIVVNIFITSGSLAQFVNVQVSNTSAKQPNEVSIAINPLDQQIVSAGSNLDYFYSTFNGGKTWKQKSMTSGWGVWGDPCIAYDAEGNLYFAHLANTTASAGGYWIDRIVVQRSANNGVNWDFDAGVGFNPPVRVQDKEWLVADQTNSKFRNNLYMTWTEFDKYGSSAPSDSSRIVFSRSTNHGETWTTPKRISNKGGDCIDSDNTVEGCVPAIGPNGEIYVSWSGPAGIVFDKSLDGGITFAGNKKVTDQVSGWDFEIPGIYRCNGMPITGCDISNSKYRGNIYINWADQKNGDGDIFFCKSIDGGNTWKSPIRVNNDILKRDQFFTWMSVDPVTGFIYIVFYDRRDNMDPTSTQTHVYLARSDDGGDTFKNYRISEAPFFPNQNVFFGDYTGVAAYNKKIFPIWMRMDGTILSVWTALINDEDFVSKVENFLSLPEGFHLYQNYPNPFNSGTVISYQLTEKARTQLKIYNLLGEEIFTLVDGIQDAGSYRITFDINRYPMTSGIYSYQLISGNFHTSKKMVYLK